LKSGNTSTCSCSNAADVLRQTEQLSVLISGIGFLNFCVLIRNIHKVKVKKSQLMNMCKTLLKDNSCTALLDTRKIVLSDRSVNK
jgi:hypothetical protein